MAKRDVIAPEVLRNLFHYDPDTGVLVWKHRPASLFRRDQDALMWNTKNAGKEAFTSTSKGYRHGAIFGRIYVAHRVIWALHYGVWPREIDHINGDRADNRISNLRVVTRAENGKNQKLHITNTTGKSGVSWCSRQQTWVARITVNGKRKHLGYFRSMSAAIAARSRADIRFGFHANHGRASEGQANNPS